MAWVKLEQSALATSRRHAVYTEVADNDSDKTLTVETNLSTTHVIRVTLIEILYVATADAGTRTLELVVSRGGTAVYTLPLDSAVHPTANETKRIHLLAGRNTIESPIAGAADNHIHTFHPNLVLGQGDSMTISDTAAIAAAADDMHIFVHAEVLSGL